MRRSRRKPKLYKVVLNYMGYGILWTLSRFIMVIPFRASSFLGEWMGVLTYHLGTEERNRALKHLRWAFEDSYTRGERRRMAFNVFRNFGRSLTEALAGTRLSTTELEAMLENPKEMKTHLESMCAEGAGMIVLTGHLGNWELGGHLASRYVRTNVVANRFHFEPFNRLAEELRTAGNCKIIYLNENPREIVRALRRSEVVAILPDLDIRRIPGTYVRFFGRPAWTPIGPALTGKVSKSPMVPYFLVRRGRKYRILIGDRIPQHFKGDRRLDAHANTQRWSEVFEDYIRQYPDQWAWNHLRWNTRPSEVPEAFRKGAVFPAEAMRYPKTRHGRAGNPSLKPET